MKKILYLMISILFLVGCGKNTSQSDLGTLKCDYFNSGFQYDTVIRVKDDKIFSLILTVISSTENELADVEESIEALFNTDFTVSEKGDYKVLTALISEGDLSVEARDLLLLNNLEEIEVFDIHNLLESIIDESTDNDIDVSCEVF